MRDLHGRRLAGCIDQGGQYLHGLLEISRVKAGLHTTGDLRNGVTPRQADNAAATHGVEALALDRYTLKRPTPKGVLLGFAAFDENTVRTGVIQLAAALGRRPVATN